MNNRNIHLKKFKIIHSNISANLKMSETILIHRFKLLLIIWTHPYLHKFLIHFIIFVRLNIYTYIFYFLPLITCNLVKEVII